MEEFAEIGRSKTSIEFKHLGNGQFSQAMTSWSDTPLKIIQLCASYSGEIIDMVGFSGMGQEPIYKRPSILVWLFSDDHGYFGRLCPKCNSYFRINGTPKIMSCPYCLCKTEFIDFCTPNQREFIKGFVEVRENAVETQTSVNVDFDEIAKNLQENSKSPWVYKEETQQTIFECTKCKMKTDILGEYAICPKCGSLNCENIFDIKLSYLENRFAVIDETVDDRHQRESEWEQLLRSVSEFEGLGNDLKKFLSTKPMTEKRRNDLKSLSFQRVINSNEKIKEWFDVDYLNGISEEDREFINKMFNKRHLFTHNNGKVDQEYINNTSDSSVRLNELIRLKSKEIKRLLHNIRIMGINFINGYNSIN